MPPTKNIGVRISLRGAKAMQKEMEAAGLGGTKSFKVLTKAINKSGRAIKRKRQSVAKLTVGMKALTSAVSIYAGLRVADSFLQASKTAEGYQIRLKVLLQSQEKANKLFADLTTFAGKVPFEFENIMDAATQLAVVMDKDASQILKFMPLIADVAAASGLSIQETAEQFRRAYAAGINSADLFRERGVKAMFGFAEGAKISAEQTRKVFEDSLGDTTKVFFGASNELAQSWEGITSMMSDKWFLFRRGVMDAAPYEFVKSAMDLMNDHFDENLDEMGDAATNFGQGIITVFKNTAVGTAKALDFVDTVVLPFAGALEMAIDGFSNLPPAIQELGLVGALMFGKKGFAILAASGVAVDLISKAVLAASDVSPLNQADDEFKSNFRRANPNASTFEVDTAAFEAYRKISERAEEIEADILSLSDTLQTKTLQATSDNASYAASVGKWIDAIEKRTVKNREDAVLRDKNIQQVQKEVAAKQALTDAEINHEAVLQETSKTYATTIEQLGNELKLLGLSGEEREAFTVQLKEEAAARKLIIAISRETGKTEKEVIALYGEQIDKVKELTAEVAKQSKTAAEAAKEAEAFLAPFIHASEEIQDAFADTFKDIFTDGIDSFEDLGDKIVNIMIAAAAEIAAALVIQGSFNFAASGGSGGGIFSAFSGDVDGGGFGAIGSIFNAGKAFLSGGSAFTGIAGDVGVGLQNLGFGADTVSAVSNGINTAGTFAGIGGGLAGNFFANSVFGSGRGIGADIGGAAGAIAGQILIPIPGIGAAIGSFLGNGLGGLFGGSDPNNASEFQSTLGVADSSSFGSKNAEEDIAKGVLAQFNGFIDTFSAIFDTDFTGSLINGGYNRKYAGGFFIGSGANGNATNRYNFDPEDAASVSEAFFSLATELLNTKEGAEDLLAAYAELDISGKNMEQVLRDLSIATGDFQENFNSTLAEEIRRLEDPTGFAVEQIRGFYDAIRAEMEGIAGIDFSLIDRREQIELDNLLGNQLNEQVDLQRQLTTEINETIRNSERLTSVFRRVSDSVETALRGFDFGADSTLGLEDQRDLAKSEFLKFADLAGLGDTDAAIQAIEFGKLFRDLERQISGSNADFKEADRLVKDRLLNIQEVANRHIDIQISLQERSLEELQRIAQGIESGGIGTKPDGSNPLLKSGEDSSKLDGFNQRNQLDAGLLRSIKYTEGGYDFSDAANQSRSFATFVQSSSDQDSIEARVNTRILAEGGKSQDFDGDGIIELFSDVGASIIASNEKTAAELGKLTKLLKKST